jgi:hypothetical protein
MGSYEEICHLGENDWPKKSPCEDVPVNTITAGFGSKAFRLFNREENSICGGLHP